MGTIAEQMQKVMQEWDTQTAKFTQGETEMKAKEVKDSTQSAKILRFIEANPSVQKPRIDEYLKMNHPEIPLGHVSTMLNQFTKRNLVTREEVFNRQLNKDVYAYTIVPSEERKKIMEAKRTRRMTLVERAAIAREAKKRKAEQKEAEAKAQTDPVKIYSNIDEFINSIPLGKARDLYLALDKIFG